MMKTSKTTRMQQKVAVVVTTWSGEKFTTAEETLELAQIRRKYLTTDKTAKQVVAVVDLVPVS